MLDVPQPNSVHDSEVDMEVLEELSKEIHEYKDGSHMYLDRRIQLAIAERLDGILTVLRDVTSYSDSPQTTRVKIWNKSGQ